MNSNARAALESFLRIGNVGMANAGAVLLIIVSLAGHVTAAEEHGYSVARADTSSPQARRLSILFWTPTTIMPPCSASDSGRRSDLANQTTVAISMPEEQP